MLFKNQIYDLLFKAILMNKPNIKAIGKWEKLGKVRLKNPK